ncbi:helix-turn-helix transcriptional regulator [Nonomuraea dietziae]
MKNRITELRAERDWTQADLAQRISVSRQTINAIEKGKFDPSLPVAFRLAKVFDLTIEEVFLDEQTSLPSGPALGSVSPGAK